MKLRLLALIIFIANPLFSQNFHDTKGKLEISNSGQAVYTIPVALPPSLQNVGPTVNLTYSSGQFGGVIGQGWNISCVSAISRISSRIDVDGFMDGVDFDDNDKLALDGQRLLVKDQAVYWAPGTKYQTEIQSNTKIELEGSGNSISFIVTSSDGSRSWYGGANASDLTSYYITRFEDNKGNYVTYEYYKPNNKSLCLKEIKFSANVNGIAPLNSVIFSYAVAKRTEFSYIKGVKHEKEAILSGVEVKTNNQSFRKYAILYDNEDPQLGYQRVSQVQELNGSSEPTNPINFTYVPTPQPILSTRVTNTYSNSLLDTSYGVIPGDFDGDGKLDMVTNDKVYTNLYQGGPQTVTNGNGKTGIPVTTLSLNNKLNQFQSFATLEYEHLDEIKFTINQLNKSTNTVDNSFYKTISIPNSGSCYSNCQWNPCPSPTYVKSSNDYLEGDFNGDGVSEILIIGYGEHKSNDYQPNISGKTGDPSQNCVETLIRDESPNIGRILDINPFSSSVLGTKGYVSLPNPVVLSFGKRYVNDFNGDGKADMLVVNKNKNYVIVGFKQLNVSPWVVVELLGEGTIPNYDEVKPLMFGDFNGDSKIDFMTPVDQNSSEWGVYFSNPNPLGGEAFVRELQTIVEYKPEFITYKDSGRVDVATFKTYYAIDTNKDGKSDFMQIEIKYIQQGGTFDVNNYGTTWRISTYANNYGNTGSSTKFSFEDFNDTFDFSDSPWLPVPVVGQFKNQNANNEVVVLNNHYNTITYVNFQKDVARENLLAKVVETGTNNTYDIVYKEMSPNDGATGTSNDLSNFYSFTDAQNTVSYPNVELKRLPTNNLVSTLKNTVQGITKSQDFKYHGFIVNLNGLGVLGFEKAARSSWYTSSSSHKIWSVTENDPLLRGATYKSYTQLLSANDEFSFGNNSSSLISGTINTYNLVNSNPYTLLLDKQTTTDYLTTVVVENSSIYSNDGYYIPSTSITKNFLGGALQGTSTTTTLYDNSTGSGNTFYIGRPTQIVNMVSAYTDTFETTEKFSYSGNLLNTYEKKGNSTTSEFLVENYFYNDYGNVIKKTLSAPGMSSRTTEQVYDATGRFVTKSIDIELLETNFTYDSLYGNVLTTTNPFGFTTTNTYDNWGKIQQTTDYLGKKLVYTYLKEGDTYKNTTTGDDGSVSIKVTDLFGRLIKTGKKGFENVWSNKSFQYDYLGRKIKESEPYQGNTPLQWNTTTYDEYSRIKENLSATGLTTTLFYDGLTVSGTDGTKSTSSTKNANGHVVKATDNGGTINYEYFANGNLKQSIFEGNTLKMTYDSFGRKATLDDPSAGIYTYKYNFFGEITEETTPKGITKYTYDAFGKIIEKNVKGLTPAEKTDIVTTYTYAPDTKSLKNMLVANPNDGDSTYTYDYDPAHKRITKTTEDNQFAIFSTTLEYDSFGRVYTEEKYAKNKINDKTSTKKTKNNYSNGLLKYISDNASGTILWYAAQIDARGHVTQGSLGNGVLFHNAYDDFGFPQYSNVSKTTFTTVVVNGELQEVETTEGVLGLSYTFNKQRALLTNRVNSLFSLSETFTYDELDRLTEWGAEPELLHNNTFASTVEGFTGISGGTVTASLGKLRVTTVAAQAGAQKLVLSNARAGTKFTINAIVTKNGTDKVRVLAVEQNVTTGIFTQIDLGLANGIFQVEHIVNNDCNLYIRFDKSPASTDVGVSRTFMVDDLIIKRIRKETQAYDNKGRITTNTIGTYNYTVATKKYQNTSVALSTAGTTYYNNRPDLVVSYNAFKSPIQIKEGTNTLIDFSYNASQGRSTMFYGGTQTDRMSRTMRKHYSDDGSMEIKHNTITGDVEFITYIGGNAYSAPLLYKKSIVGAITTEDYLYLHKDHLGSIVAITNQAGNIVEKRAFDAWGNILYVKDGAGNNLSGLTVLDRGYTGHEHLQQVRLIHMNGRLYDPMLHRFLQPDNFIQDPYNTQNYNRYGYVLNNPLKYSDPSGEEILTAIVVGAIISATIYSVSAWLADRPITLGGFATATFMGALSGAATCGIGAGANAIIGNFFLRACVQALAHGVFQGGMSYINSGDFWTGFATGSIASLAASAYGGGTSTTTNADGSITQTAHKGINGFIGGNREMGMLMFGTLSGGAAAQLTGGNFFIGAATGLVVVALNHMQHMIAERNDLLSRFNKINPHEEAPKNINSINALLNDVGGLKSFHKASGEYELKYGGESKEYRGYTVDKTKTHYFYDGAFDSYYKLASTMFHEMYHAFQNNYNGGYMYTVLGNIGYDTGYRNGAPMKGERVLEWNAYNFEYNFLGNQSSYVRDGLNLYKY